MHITYPYGTTLRLRRVHFMIRLEWPLWRASEDKEPAILACADDLPRRAGRGPHVLRASGARCIKFDGPLSSLGSFCP